MVDPAESMSMAFKTVVQTNMLQVFVPPLLSYHFVPTHILTFVFTIVQLWDPDVALERVSLSNFAYHNFFWNSADRTH